MEALIAEWQKDLPVRRMGDTVYRGAGTLSLPRQRSLRLYDGGLYPVDGGSVKGCIEGEHSKRNGQEEGGVPTGNPAIR